MILRPKVAAGLGLAVVAAVWVVRVATLSRYEAVASPDSGARLEMVRTFLSGGSLFHVAGPLELHPFSFYLASVPAGNVFFYAPLFPLLSAVPFRLAGFPGLVVLPLLAGLAACGATALAGKRLGLAAWPALIPVTGLATALFFYSVLFWDHSLLVAVAAGAAYGMARGDLRGGVVAGALLGAGTFLHELVILLGCAVVAAGLLCRSTRRAAAVAGAAFGTGLAAWSALNVALYGLPVSAHSRGVNQPSAEFLLREMSPPRLWDRAVEELAGWPTNATVHRFALVFLAGLFLAARFVPRSTRLLPEILCGAAFFSFAADRTNHVVGGLFTASPFLCLALLAPLAAKAGSAPRDVAAAWMARSSLLFGLAVLLLPVGPGWGWGSRYLLTAIPLLVLLAARAAEELLAAEAPLGGQLALAAFLAGSVVLQWHGTNAIRGAYRSWSTLRSEVNRSQAEVLLTDSFAVGPCLVPIGLAKPVLYLDRPGFGPILRERLDREGVRTIGWFGRKEGLENLLLELSASRPPFVRAASKDVGSVEILERPPAS